MEDGRYYRLKATICRFPHLRQFLDDDFIREQCDSDLKCHILRRLDNRKSSYNMCRHLPTLEGRLAQLATVTGYDRLGALLRRASDWDQYQEALAQIDVTLWFKRNNLLKEIEPVLPHRAGRGDVLLSFSGQDIFCEVNSPQSIAKSIESRNVSESTGAEKQSKNAKRRLRVLLGKTDDQLPPDYAGILALETGKSAVFELDVAQLAQRLFPQRPHVALIMLWSWEGNGGDDLELGGWKMDYLTSCFINGGSKFRVVGEELLKHLGLKGQVLGT